MDLVNIMKALGDETRIRILTLLYKSELCVREIEYVMKINQSNASRHLNKLSIAGLVKYKKSALFVYYNLNNAALEQFPFLKEFLNMETAKLPSCMSDISRLERYKSTGLTCGDLNNGKVDFTD